MISDVSAGAYASRYPIVTLGSEDVPLRNMDYITSSLDRQNIWYDLSEAAIKALMVYRVLRLQQGIEPIIAKAKEKDPSLEVCHMSVGGSYPWKPALVDINDIDFNLIVKGSAFDYYDVFDAGFVQEYATNKLQKISFMIFGEDNIVNGMPVDDSIQTKDYLHTDMTIREGVVMPFRNATICGRDIFAGADNQSALLTRIDRQLYQADLLMDGTIGQKYSAAEKQDKAFGRTVEAGILLLSRFHQSHDDLCAFYEKTNNQKTIDGQSLSLLRQEVKKLRDSVPFQKPEVR